MTDADVVNVQQEDDNGVVEMWANNRNDELVDSYLVKSERFIYKE